MPMTRTGISAVELERLTGLEHQRHKRATRSCLLHAMPLLTPRTGKGSHRVRRIPLENKPPRLDAITILLGRVWLVLRGGAWHTRLVIQSQALWCWRCQTFAHYRTSARRSWLRLKYHGRPRFVPNRLSGSSGRFLLFAGPLRRSERRMERPDDTFRGVQLSAGLRQRPYIGRHRNPVLCP